MSHWFKGVYYASYSDYIRAKELDELRSSAAQLSVLRDEAARHQKRLRAVESELGAAQASAERMAELNREMQTELGGLHRVQSTMQRAQQKHEAESRASFQEIRKQAEQAGEDLAALDRAHHEHEAKVAQQFDQGRVELQNGLQEAAQRQQESEARLTGEINAINAREKARVDALKAEELSDTQKATGLDLYVGEQVKKLEARKDELGMRGEIDRINSRREDVNEALAKGKPIVALTGATENLTALRAAESEFNLRSLELCAAQKRSADTAAHLTELLADPAAQHFFKIPTAQMTAHLKRITEKLAFTHARWDRKHFQDKIDEQLQKLEADTLMILSEAPMLKEKDDKRNERANECLDHLEEVFGTLQVQSSYYIPNDAKSDQVMTCTMKNNEKVKLFFPIDPNGTTHVEGYGQSTNAECQQTAALVAEVLQKQMRITGRHQDPGTVQQSTFRPQQPRSPWEGLDERLSKLGSEL